MIGGRYWNEVLALSAGMQFARWHAPHLRWRVEYRPDPRWPDHPWVTVGERDG